MKSRIVLFLSLCLAAPLQIAQAALQDGLVAYWPLDVLTNDPGTGMNVTPDLGPNGNNLVDNYTMSSGGLVPGIRGNAASFDGSLNYLSLAYTADEDRGLPAYNARYYTISMWVRDGKNVSGTNQQARAVFAEGSDLSTSPLFRLSTDTATSAALRTNVLAALVRNDNNNTFFGSTLAFADSGKSTLMPFDGNWHHIAWVDENGTARLYVDGQLDPHVFRNTRLPEPTGVSGTVTLNTISLGAAAQSTAGSYFNGLIDDVAIWERALSQSEIDEVRSNGIPTPITAAAPVMLADPVGDTNLLVGEFFSLQGLATGVHPRTYQWYKDSLPLQDLIETNELGEITNAPITGTMSNILVLTNLQASYSGDYRVVIGNSQGSVTSAPATLLVSMVAPQTANLTNGEVAYWPLDAVEGLTTPDVVRGYDMYLYQMSSDNLVPGRWGNAMQFRTNGLLTHIFGPDDALPLSQYRDFTISLWLNAPADNTGMRFFTEGNSYSTQPYFSLANPDNTGQGPLTRMRGFFRNDNNQNNSTVGISGLDILYDPALTNSAWHHVAYVQRWVGGATPVLEATLFVDGVKDSAPVSAFSPRVPLTAHIVSIGGTVRNATDPLAGGSRGNYFAGLIDDVAVWNRALTAEEIEMLSTNVTPAAPAMIQPLAISSFRADFAEVVVEDPITLRWNVAGLTPSATLSLDQGIGSVLGRTTNGIGTIVISNVTASTTYTLTAQRGTNVLTAQTGVEAISGVAPGWSILDDFQSYGVGPLVNPYWGDLRGGSSIEQVGGNRMLNAAAGGGGEGQVAVLPLADLMVREGEARTLFARIYVQDDPLATTVLNDVGVTDKTLRTHNDLGTDTGPVARINDDAAGDIAVGAYEGVGGPLVLVSRKLEQGQVYNLWIDVTNGPFVTSVESTNAGDIFSIWLQRLGETSRTLIVSNYPTDRDLVPDFLGPTGVNLDKLVVGNGDASGTVYVDDVFISKSGYNSTVPVAWAGPTPPVLSAPVFSSADFTASPGQILFLWDAGALMYAPDMSGPWRVVPDSYGYYLLYTMDPANPGQFFRLQR